MPLRAPSRDGELRGLAVHIEVGMAAGDAVDISSARAGSHWPNVLLLLDDPVDVRAGADRLRVRCRAALGSERPRHHEGDGRDWVGVASRLAAASKPAAWRRARP